MVLTPKSHSIPLLKKPLNPIKKSFTSSVISLRLSKFSPWPGAKNLKKYCATNEPLEPSDKLLFGSDDCLCRVPILKGSKKLKS